MVRYEAEEVAAQLDLLLFTASAKEDINISLVFQHLADSHCRAREARPAQNRIYTPRYSKTSKQIV